MHQVAQIAIILRWQFQNIHGDPKQLLQACRIHEQSVAASSEQFFYLAFSFFDADDRVSACGTIFIIGHGFRSCAREMLLEALSDFQWEDDEFIMAEDDAIISSACQKNGDTNEGDNNQLEIKQAKSMVPSKPYNTSSHGKFARLRTRVKVTAKQNKVYDNVQLSC